MTAQLVEIWADREPLGNVYGRRVILQRTTERGLAVVAIGKLLDMGAFPAPFVRILEDDAPGEQGTIVFVGPGHVLGHAPPAHPALG